MKGVNLPNDNFIQGSKKRRSTAFEMQYPKTTFCTNSTYEGVWSNTEFGLSEKYGFYNLFYGVEHRGYCEDSMFEGPGVLVYPNRATMEGIWQNGRLIGHKYRYADKMSYGPHCQPPDRRFNIEKKTGLRPAGMSYMTSTGKVPVIPKGCYDVGDGFYDPKKHCVYDYRCQPRKIIRIPTKSEAEWIVDHCRRSEIQSVGDRIKCFDQNYELHEDIISQTTSSSNRTLTR